MMLRVGAVIAAVGICDPGSVGAQTGSPAISGQVRSAGGDAPLRRARIVVTGGRWTSEPVLTDNEGGFRVQVPGAVIGPLTVTVTKGGYVTATVKAAAVDFQSAIVVRLFRGAAISGAVVDRSGAPAIETAVTASRIGGAEDATVPAQYSTTTDDRGEFRLYGLSQGRYELWAGAAITIVVEPPRVAGSPAAAVSVRREVGAGDKTLLTIDAAADIGGIQLIAPDRNAAELALKAMRESGDVPPNSLTSVIAGSAGVLIDAPPPVQPPLRNGAGAGIRGRVLSSSRQPVANATVRVEGPGVDRAVRTDAGGAFSLVGLPAGQYIVQANMERHMPWQYGQGGPGRSGRPVTFAADQVIDGFEIVLPPGRAISGFVVDEFGEPVLGARVQALQLKYAGGRMVATPAGNPASTDDRGRYRVWGLQPGPYLLSATFTGLVATRTGQAPYATIYFPATPVVGEAAPIDVREDATANLALVPFPLSEVSGVARDGDAALVSGTARLIESRRSGLVTTTPRSAAVQMDGSFVIRNVPPGEYVLQVRGDGPGRTGLFGTQELLVGREPVDVMLKTSYGTNVAGRVVIEGAVEERCPGGRTSGSPTSCFGGTSLFQLMPVALDDRARESTSNVVISNGEFFLTNGLFGHTALTLQRAPGDSWYLKSWTINGADLADTGYDFGAQPREISDSEIVLSRNGATIAGRAADAIKPVDDYFVVVFPVARDLRWPGSRRLAFARSTTTGAFRVSGLPPGDYLIAAVSQLLGTRDGGEWQDPDRLLQLEARAERITLAEGQSANVSLRLIER
jgi:hypothetical protein